MTVREVYEAMGEDYGEIFRRFKNEKMICRFITQFRSEDALSGLREAVEREDWEKVFAIAHSVKGLSLNLGLGQLNRAADALCGAVRGEVAGDVAPLYEAVKEVYEQNMECVGKLAV